MADFKDAKKNLHREWGLLSEARGGGPTPQPDRILARRVPRNFGEGVGWHRSSGQRGGGAVTRSSLLSSDGDLGKAKPLSVARGACGLLAVQVGPESI